MDQEIFKHTKKVNYSFNPYLLPTFRGILTAIYVKVKKGKSINIIRKELKNIIKTQNLLKS